MNPKEPKPTDTYISGLQDTPASAFRSKHEHEHGMGMVVPDLASFVALHAQPDPVGRRSHPHLITRLQYVTP